jgi:hypothetical protein
MRARDPADDGVVRDERPGDDAAGDEQHVRVWQLVDDACARTSRKPDSSVTGPAFAATNATSAPGSEESTWKGPRASREVNRS